MIVVINMDNCKHINKLKIIAHSEFEPKHGSIQSAKRKNYCIVKDFSISGDAPKDFIRLYRYGLCKKVSISSWPLYIAKLGHKHYPIESITEFLLNRIGRILGFNMSESELLRFDGQIRFLSKYFLPKNNSQILEHGADLYAGY